MGVYIKRFDFPKACWFCDFCRAYNEPNHGYFCCALNADLDKTTEIIQTQRDKHCPLVEVKSHGRLIDADELRGWYDFHSYDVDDDDFLTEEEFDKLMVATAVVRQNIDDAPTIIEAEGE